MTYPTKAELLSLDYVFEGQPFVQVPASTQTTASLDVAYDGQPYTATDLTAAPPAATSRPQIFLCT